MTERAESVGPSEQRAVSSVQDPRRCRTSHPRPDVEAREFPYVAKSQVLDVVAAASTKVAAEASHPGEVLLAGACRPSTLSPKPKDCLLQWIVVDHELIYARPAGRICQRYAEPEQPASPPGIRSLRITSDSG